jgi:hypothetical protein
MSWLAQLFKGSRPGPEPGPRTALEGNMNFEIEEDEMKVAWMRRKHNLSNIQNIIDCSHSSTSTGRYSKSPEI